MSECVKTAGYGGQATTFGTPRPPHISQKCGGGWIIGRQEGGFPEFSIEKTKQIVENRRVLVVLAPGPVLFENSAKTEANYAKIRRKR